MIVYIGAVLWLGLVGLLGSKDRRTYIIAVAPLFLLIILRSNLVGNDTGAQWNSFTTIQNYSFASILEGSSLPWGLQRIEKGYFLAMKFVGLISKDPIVFQIVSTGFVSYSVCRFFWKNTEEPVWGVFFYATLGIYFFSFTGMRQTIAMSICLFAYSAAKGRKLIKFLIIMFIATLFHKSAFLFLPVYLLVTRKANIKNYILYFAVALVASVYLDSIQSWFGGVLGYSYEIEETGNGVIFFLLFTSFNILSIILRHNDSIIWEHDDIITLSIVANIFYLLRVFTRTAERPSYYYAFFACAFFAQILHSINDRNTRRLVATAFAVLSFSLFVYRLSYDPTNIVPYSFFWTVSR